MEITNLPTEEYKQMKIEIKELKSELEGKEEMLNEVIFQQDEEIKQLKAENQSLHDQITEMENERSRIDKLVKTIGKFVEDVVKIGV